MKLAIPYENGTVFQHFGKTAQFKFYDVQDNRIVSTIVVDTVGSGHSELAGFLSDHDVDAVICGGIGEGALNALAEANITVIGGASGKADEAAEAYLIGSIEGSDSPSCSHHDACGDGCGEGGCGGCCSGQVSDITGKNAGKNVAVHYRGTFNDGTVFDSSYDRNQPLEFACAAGRMIHGFDAAVADMEVGEKKTIHLMPEEAYGAYNPNFVMHVPFSDLPGSSDLNVGEQVFIADELGRRFMVTVTEKDDNSVTLDGNHPMAGKELNFEIELLRAS